MKPKQIAKPLYWVASSQKDLLAMPKAIVSAFGYGLHQAQIGKQHVSAKVLKGFGGAGVLELIESDEGGTYRAVYTVRFGQSIYVLHCFQKKSKQGIKTPQEDMNLIRSRLKTAEQIEQRKTL
jgi:phage-related protein